MAKILVVDDTAIDRWRAGAILEKELVDPDLPPSRRLEVAYASNGREATEILRKAPPDLILTDLMMPEMNGLELVRAVRDHFPHIPVILMTAHGSEDIAAVALQVGAAGYVPKKHLIRDLRETVDNVLSLTQEGREERRVMQFLALADTTFELPNDLALVTPLVCLLQNNLRRLALCDYADELRVTIALREALVNAIMHGNLEIPSPADDEVHDATAFRSRASQAPYKDRRVQVHARETREQVVYRIRDQGPGFDVSTVPDPTDAAKVSKSSGRVRPRPIFDWHFYGQGRA